MNHSFDVGIATKYGLNVAIVLNHIAFWVQKNQANEKHFHDGRYWTYNSIKAFQVLFPYWSFKQMRLILDKLKETGLVITGNYNETGYDQTQWYALSDEALELFGLPKAVDKSAAICPNGQIESPKRARSFAQKGKPIPDINTDIKTDNKSFYKNDQKINKQKDSLSDKSTTGARTAPLDKRRYENERKHPWAEKKDEVKSNVKFYEPGHPDYDRIYGKQAT
jgi:hypothetical protein